MAVVEHRFEAGWHRRRKKTFAGLAIMVLSLRWVAGIVENLGASHLSEVMALAGLGAMLLFFIAAPAIPRVAGTFCLGISGLILASALSIVVNFQTSAPAGSKLILLLLFYLLFATLVWRDYDRAAQSRAQQLLVWFLICGGVISIAQMGLGIGFIEIGREHEMRAIGSDVHPVSFGIQAVIAMTGLIVVQRSGCHIQRSVFFVAMALGIVALYLTFARTAWAMGAIVAITVALCSGPIWRRLSATLVLIVLVYLIVGMSARFGDLASLPAFLQQLDFDNVVFDYRFVDNSVSWRIVNWSYGFAQALEKPWLGHGPGSSALASNFNLEMHNVILEVFFELGLTGVIAFAFVFFGLLKFQRAASLRLGHDPVARNAVRGLGIAMFAAVMFSTSLVDQLISITLYLLVLRISESAGT